MMKNETRDGARRAAAGRALVIFLIVMAALTLVNRTLTDMVIPTVSAYAPQRGALEIQINADGVLAAAVHAPVVVPEAARVREILVKNGAGVKIGDPLATLDYGDVLKEKYTALSDAIVNSADKQRAYDRASADVSSSAISMLKSRREALDAAEMALTKMQEELTAAKGDDNIAAAQRNLRRAQEDVDYRKRKVDELTDVRNFVDAGKDLASAQEKLKDAADAYFDINQLLHDNPYADASGSALIGEAVRAVQNGGSVSDVLAFDPQGECISVLTSPVMGDIISVDVNVGAVVSTNAAVMTISDRSRELKLTVEVGDDKVGDMASGDIAQIIVDTDMFDCPVTSIAASVSNPGMFEVEFILPGAAGAVGMRASMRFRKRTQNYDILIPLNALRSDNDGDFVYVVDQSEGSLGLNTTVRRVGVYALEKDSTRAALQSGVSPRDLIVARSDRSIGDGDRVRLEGN